MCYKKPFDKVDNLVTSSQKISGKFPTEMLSGFIQYQTKASVFQYDI